jgi:uncharacterized protein (TIGR01777 family)
MRIAVTGASGFVGTALVARLRSDGHTVVPLSRSAASGTCRWDPATGELDLQALGSPDAVVHLAGESVAGGRWTHARKVAIRQSRGPATTALCKRLATLPTPPKVFVSASGVGIYGDRGDELLDESSRPGEGFLAAVAQEWEAGCAPLAGIGCRTAQMRISMVLDADGGALAKMLLPFKLGLGGRLGSGRQWMSWISRADLVAAIAFVLTHEQVRGPVVAAAPQAVTNREFTKALGKALHRPTILPAPAFALRLLLGDMADELLLASQRCQPRALLAAGFAFADADLGTLLAACVRR